MQRTRLQTEAQRMVITTKQCFEQQSCGKTILSDQLSQWTLQSVWHWSSLQESWRLSQLTILGWMRWPTSQLPENLQSKIGLIWMLSRSPKNAWCDYCKLRYGTQDLKGQKPATWQITCKRYNKVIIRNYCQSCTNEVQAWPDGTTWTLKEQIDYAQGRQTLDV